MLAASVAILTLSSILNFQLQMPPIQESRAHGALAELVSNILANLNMILHSIIAPIKTLKRDLIRLKMKLRVLYLH